MALAGSSARASAIAEEAFAPGVHVSAFNWSSLWPWNWPGFSQPWGGSEDAPADPAAKQGEADTHPPDITFADVGGMEAAKDELREVVAMFADSEFYEALGARTPKGIMLDGPPGTGKTLLARALAGEVKATFLSLDAGMFNQKYAGDGGRSVRSLFAYARANAPAVIFIDEIDAIGTKRFPAQQAYDVERTATLDTLLAQLDGFLPSEKILVVAATNRYSDLDAALIRSGRFDRRISLSLPQEPDRLRILQVHLQHRPLSPDVDLKTVVGASAGMSGADLANLCNEAATLAARAHHSSISQDDLIEGTHRVRFGVQGQIILPDANMQLRAAVHEAGHSMLFVLCPTVLRLKEATIRPRMAGAGGMTLTAPRREGGADISLAEAKNWLIAMMGGRAAETLYFNGSGSGSSSDMAQATKLAFQMVSEWGLGTHGAPVNYGTLQALRAGAWTQASGERLDCAVEQLVQQAYDSALRILSENQESLERVSSALVARQTLYEDEITALMDE